MTSGLITPGSFMGLPPGPPGPGCRAAILGVPFDCGTHPFRVGARQGPEAVRAQSGLIRRFHPTRADVDVLARLGAVDCGDVALTPGRIDEALPLIEAAAGTILDAGAVPVGIGGDGSVSLALMRAAGRRHPGLVALHIDSHTDAYAWTAEDRYNAATQFTHAAEEGVVDAALSWHVGVRGFTYCPGVLGQTTGLGFRVITIEDLLRRGFAQCLSEFRDAIGPRPVYLCWDMDVFDPSVAPGVVTPAWGGLTIVEGLELLGELASLNVVVFDVNTVSPTHDLRDQTGSLAAHVVLEFLKALVERA